MNNQSALTCLSDLIGVEFEYGGRGQGSLDCWGLVREAYRRWHGIDLPDYRSSPDHTANAMIMEAEGQRLWRRLDEIAVGSVILMRIQGIGAHVGFVHHRTRFLHAREHTGVVEAKTRDYRRLIIGAYQYVGAEPQGNGRLQPV